MVVTLAPMIVCSPVDIGGRDEVVEGNNGKVKDGHNHDLVTCARVSE